MTPETLSDAHTHPPRLSQPVSVRLWLDGARDIETIALEAGVATRTVYRQLENAGLREKRVFVPPRDDELVLSRVREGMPVTWAIEGTDVGYNRACELASRIPGRAQLVAEWQRAWQRIAITETLLLIHDEIAPPTSHSYNTARVAA